MYHYRALTPDGERITGSIAADSPDAVVAHLKTRALFITAVSSQDSPQGRLAAVWTLARWRGGPRVALFRSLATLVRAGIPLTRSLEIATTQCSNRQLREALLSTKADVEAGSPLSSSLGRHAGMIKPLHLAMIEAGEAGGLLDDVLDRIAVLLERERGFRKKLGTALAYPTCVIAVTGALTLFLVLTVVPTFAQMFDQLQVPLPEQTRFLLAAGGIMHRPLLVSVLLGSLIVLPFLATVAFRNAFVASAIQNGVLKLPVGGPLLRKVITTRICRMLGDLLQSGVNLLRAVEIVGPVSGHGIYYIALQRAHSSLRAGDAFAEVLARSRLFDPLLIALARVGEETGALDQMLFQVADFYDADIEAATSTAAALIEPFLMLALGSLVGAIVFSIFVPLYTVISQVR